MRGISYGSPSVFGIDLMTAEALGEHEGCVRIRFADGESLLLSFDGPNAKRKARAYIEAINTATTRLRDLQDNQSLSDFDSFNAETVSKEMAV